MKIQFAIVSCSLRFAVCNESLLYNQTTTQIKYKIRPLDLNIFISKKTVQHSQNYESLKGLFKWVFSCLSALRIEFPMQVFNILGYLSSCDSVVRSNRTVANKQAWMPTAL